MNEIAADGAAGGRAPPAWRDAALLFGAALLLHLLRLDALPMWSDEAFSVLWARQGLPFVFGPGAAIETNPPFHFALLRGWSLLFGDGAFAARLPSALMASAAVAATYGTGRLLRGRWVGLLAGLLLLLSPTLLLYGSEARAYAGVILCAALAIWAVARDDRLAAAGVPARRRLGGILGFALASATAVALHYTAAVMVPALAAPVALRWAAALRRGQPLPRGDLPAWGAAGLVFALLAGWPLILAAAASRSPNIGWIPPLSLRDLFGYLLPNFLSEVVAGEARPRVLAVAAAALVLGAIAALWAGTARRIDAACWRLLALPPALFVLLLLLVSLGRPLFVSRAATWLPVFLALLLATGIGALRRPGARRAAAAAALLLFAALSAWQGLVRQKEDWRAAALILRDDPACAGEVLFHPLSPPFALAYEQPALAGRAARVLLPAGADWPITAETLLAQRVFGGLGRADREGAESSLPPGTALILRGRITPPAALQSLQPLLDGARLRRDLAGGLVLACR